MPWPAWGSPKAVTASDGLLALAGDRKVPGQACGGNPAIGCCANPLLQVEGTDEPATTHPAILVPDAVQMSSQEQACLDFAPGAVKADTVDGPGGAPGRSLKRQEAEGVKYSPVTR